MAGEVLQLDDLLDKDDIACRIASQWHEWNSLRRTWISEKEEIRQYVFAVDTSKTSNNDLPWKNKTHVPKLCQIRDNLYANYMRTLFPKRKWLKWVAYDNASDDSEKRKSIEGYIQWAIERSNFKNTTAKLVLDWIDYGNCFAKIDWVDHRQTTEQGERIGYVGPSVVRISPLDIVFNPIAASFENSPKIIRSLVSLGDVKEYLSRLTTDQNREAMNQLFQYLRDIRLSIGGSQNEIQSKDNSFTVDGFESFQSYLASDYCELLTFYGDMYDAEKDKFYKNHIIVCVDRHKVLSIEPNPSLLGQPPLFHVGWRVRQDNLWAMGPLDNLVGMQYRIDHIENLKADIFDLTTFPVLKIKGTTEDFEWGPMARIYVGDEGDVDMVVPDVNALNANLEINSLEQKMEEMAGSPKEAMGFRTPGEKTAYEVQRLENAAGRIFQAKTEMFEEIFLEPILTGMLELARRNLDQTEIGVFDDEFKVTIFTTLSASDITGNGKIKPMAARHFAENAEKVQNLTQFFATVGQDPAINVHYSGVKLAEMFEDMLEVEGYGLVQPFIRLSEQAEGQRLANTHQEQTLMQANAPSGLTPGDHSTPLPGGPPIQ